MNIHELPCVFTSSIIYATRFQISNCDFDLFSKSYDSKNEKVVLNNARNFEDRIEDMFRIQCI